MISMCVLCNVFYIELVNIKNLHLYTRVNYCLSFVQI